MSDASVQEDKHPLRTEKQLPNQGTEEASAIGLQRPAKAVWVNLNPQTGLPIVADC
jgi:hypothetical protein